MIVTAIKPVTKTKFKIYLDDKAAFVLYKGEMERFHIREGSELAPEHVLRIKQDCLLKRAKLRALHLLNVMDRTEDGLRKKLRENQYPEDVIEQAIQYVKGFGYIDDLRYAKQYVSSRQMKKSKREIQIEMQQKGLDREVIACALEECYSEGGEEDAIRRVLEKKRYCAETATDKEKKKIFDYLMRKGFSYEDIRQVIQVSHWNA